MSVALAMLLSTALSASPESSCACPKDDPTTHGATQTLIDKELSSAERMPASSALGFPKTLTVCMFFDQTNKGYPQELKLVVESSIDSHHWFPATVTGGEVQASSANGCIQVAPSRYIRVGWPPSANVPSPGPHVLAQVEASY
jgi:hypothetical protein